MKKHSLKASTVKAADTAVTYLIIAFISAIFFIPCIWIVLASFSKSGSIYSFDGFFPSAYSFDSFVKLFTDTGTYNYPLWFANTFKIAACAAIIGTILVLLTAYCMSRYRFKGRKAMMKATLVLGMFPSFMSMTAVYLFMTQLNAVNTHWGLIFIYSAGAPLGYMVYKGFFDTIPISIDEAAKLDGATNFQIFLRITLPLSKPMIVYAVLMSFASPWSDYLLSSLLLKDKGLWTVAQGLMYMPDTEFSRYAAGSVFIAVPIMALYICLIRYMVNGMTSGAVKD